jgi:hypothetical protein
LQTPVPSSRTPSRLLAQNQLAKLYLDFFTNANTLQDLGRFPWQSP